MVKIKVNNERLAEKQESAVKVGCEILKEIKKELGKFDKFDKQLNNPQWREWLRGELNDMKGVLERFEQGL